jgi:hypothetical protein
MLGLFLTMSFINLSWGTNTEKTLCLPNEKIIFSCPIKKKWASVCAQEPTKGSPVSIQYRFGIPEKREIAIPEKGLENVSFRHLMYSGGGGAYVLFKNQDINYIVYSRITKNGEEAGILVRREQQRLNSLLCQKGSQHAEIDAALLKKLGLSQAGEVDPLSDE